MTLKKQKVQVTKVGAVYYAAIRELLDEYIWRFPNCLISNTARQI
jgi:hypothetical protein